MARPTSNPWLPLIPIFRFRLENGNQRLHGLIKSKSLKIAASDLEALRPGWSTTWLPQAPQGQPQPDSAVL